MARIIMHHDAGGSPGFCHRPALDKGKAKSFLEGSMMLRGNSGTKTKPNLIGKVVIRRGVGLQQDGRYDAQIVNNRGFAVAQCLPPGPRVKAIQLYQAVSGHHGGHEGERE